LGKKQGYVYVGERSTMHASSCQIVTVNTFHNAEGLLTVLLKKPNICIINKDITRSWKVRGVASINEFSIVEKNEN
jgi:hypothetical protein